MPLPIRPLLGRRWLAPVLLALAALTAYGNAWRVPFVYDDEPAIVENATLRSRNLAAWLRPPVDTTVEGRPLLNLTFAWNYSWGELEVTGYHAVNLAIHIYAGLVLFGLVRRTLSRLPSPAADDASRRCVALGAALLWLLHPLQTESVTYVVQRAESLMGLLFLLTLYLFVRAVESKRTWPVGAWLACALGMATKEVMVVAPLVVLAYDRVFCSASWRELWRMRGGWHLALASTWLVPALLLATNGGTRGGSAGFGQGVDVAAYALRQLTAVSHYFSLTFWPHALVFDYGRSVVVSPREAILAGLVVATFLTATVICLWRSPRVGFMGLCCFAILAPTSSIVPIVTEPAAEHRMYLVLAAPAVALVAGLHRVLGRAAVLPVLALAIGFGVATFARNAAYASPVQLWRDSAAKAPQNPRAFNQLGQAQYRAGDLAAAREAYARAAELDPRDAEAHFNLGTLFSHEKAWPRAIVELETAVRLAPSHAKARDNLGLAYAAVGRETDALREHAAAVRCAPRNAIAHNNYGIALGKTGRLTEAIAEFQAALALDGGYAAAQANLLHARKLLLAP